MQRVGVVLRVDLHLRARQESRVEAHSKLTDEIKAAGLDGLQEVGGAGLCNCSEVLNQVLLRHADAIVLDAERLGLLVELDFDL